MSTSNTKRLTIIVLGYIVRGPIGGRVWADLHYLLGLRALGHDVYFVEDSGDYDDCCYDFEKNIATNDPSYGIDVARQLFDGLQFGDHWAYYDAHTNKWFGKLGNKIIDVIKRADLLIGFCRLHQMRSWLERIPVRILIDKDPFFSQLRNINHKPFHEELEKYTHFFTFFENLKLTNAIFPKDGVAWQTTRHPIFLDAWPKMNPQKGEGFTTFMYWDSYEVENYEGKVFGMKSMTFKEIITLPRKSNNKFELVVSVKGSIKRMLEENGWAISDPILSSMDIYSYQKYIQNSKAEFTAAKHGYVASYSGWFSERSASYLASGRPVITQQTGFSEWLPTGAGVLAFENMEQAIAAVEEVNNRYEYHCKRAREIAVEYFDYRKILSSLLDKALDSKT